MFLKLICRPKVETVAAHGNMPSPANSCGKEHAVYAALFGVFRLLGSLDHLLLEFARHFFVMAEVLHVDAASAGERA